MGQIPAKTEARELTDDERASLVRAFEGDEQAGVEMRKLLRREPELASTMAGDAAESAIDLLLKQVWASHPVARDAVRARMRSTS